MLKSRFPPTLPDPYIRFRIFKNTDTGKWFLYQRKAGFENWEYLNYYGTFELARTQAARFVDMVTHFQVQLKNKPDQSWRE